MTYAVRSSRGTVYTVLYENGEWSCDCPGWTFKRKGQARGCKHTRAGEAGTLTQDFEIATQAAPAPSLHTSTPAAKLGRKAVI